MINLTLEQKCIAVLAKQMGPAAKIFLDRQCRLHLKKEPAKLDITDIPALANYCFSGTQATLGVVAANNIKIGILELK
jgi:hypothetical protein